MITISNEGPSHLRADKCLTSYRYLVTLEIAVKWLGETRLQQDDG